MPTLYLDLFSGISGDMFLGAMLDLGVDLDALRRTLEELGVPGWQLRVERRAAQYIQGTKLDVLITSPETVASGHEHDHEHGHEHGHERGHGHGVEQDHHRHGDQHHDQHAHGQACRDTQPHAHRHPHEHGHGRSHREIKEIITASTLSDWTKQHALSIFERVAHAEGAIHGVDPLEVQFHEVGALDSIVDIVGACVALELLGKPRVLASPVIDGTGFVNCAHGRFPVPTPATLAILAARAAPITQCEEPHELVTPTGAAIVAEFAESFGRLAGFVPRKVGYGLGTRINETRPNVLRAVLGEEQPTARTHDWEQDSVAVLETNLDDISSEVLGYFVDLALKAGALDVFHTPISMKKSRPGVLLSVLCPPERADELTALMLRETSAFGVRRTLAERRKLRRESRQVTTPFGAIDVKLGMLDGEVLHRAPEYESCRLAAERAGQPLRLVYEAVVRAAAGQTD